MMEYAKILNNSVTFLSNSRSQEERTYCTYVLDNIHLRKMNVTPLAILGVKWPFSKGRGR